jgi:hypothetical protein
MARHVGCLVVFGVALVSACHDGAEDITRDAAVDDASTGGQSAATGGFGGSGGSGQSGGGAPNDGGGTGGDGSGGDGSAAAGSAEDGGPHPTGPEGGLVLDASGDSGGDGGGETGQHFTTFPMDEDPISENGAWSAIATPWLRVKSVDGIAKPAAFVTGYNDNYASLSGFGPDVEITVTVFIAGSAPFGEILLLARIAQTATTLRAYEFLYDGDGSVQLMRWNGPLSDFTPMGGEELNPGVLQDGDQLRMRVVGDTISAFHKRAPGDWVRIAQTTDGTFSDGQPGLGFFVRDEGQSIENIGVKDYSVREIP